MVWPTLIPKYSLTSQKPASLTWEKNSEPAPTASTSSEVSPVLRPAASGARIRPDGGDRWRRSPSRWRGGSAPRPARRAAAPRCCAPSAQSAITRADAGVDQGLLEAAAGADDQQDAGDRRAATSRPSRRRSRGPCPTPRPRVNMATRTAISSATSGVPRKSKHRCRPCPWSSMTMSTSALPSISTTGSSTVASGDAERRARRSQLVGRRAPASTVGSGAGHVAPSGRRPAPNSGPATIDGRARRPARRAPRVMPRSA